MQSSRQYCNQCAVPNMSTLLSTRTQKKNLQINRIYIIVALWAAITIFKTRIFLQPFSFKNCTKFGTEVQYHLLTINCKYDWLVLVILKLLLAIPCLVASTIIYPHFTILGMNRRIWNPTIWYAITMRIIVTMEWWWLLSRWVGFPGFIVLGWTHDSSTWTLWSISMNITICCRIKWWTYPRRFCHWMRQASGICYTSYLRHWAIKIKRKIFQCLKWKMWLRLN